MNLLSLLRRPSRSVASRTADDTEFPYDEAWKKNRVPLDLQAVDLATGELVQAEFYLNGVRVSDRAMVPIGMTVSVQARAEGYEDSVQQLAVTGSLQGQVVLPMRRRASGVPCRFQVAPPVAGTRIVLSGPSGQRELTASLDGSAEVSLEPGSWTVSASAPGYEGYTAEFQVRRPVSIDIQLVRSRPQESERSFRASWMELPQPSLAVNPAEALVPLESGAPAYYTSAQCRLYIGDLFIDELQSIRWLVQASVVPVFGYCSQFPDAFARGRSQVQGELVINYVHPGYLLAAVRRYGSRSGPVRAENLGGLFLEADFGRLEQERLIRRGSRREPVPANPLYLHKPFDMRLEIGDGPWRGSRFLERCMLISNEIVVAPDGQPIAEAYGFVARRAR